MWWPWWSEWWSSERPTFPVTAMFSNQIALLSTRPNDCNGSAYVHIKSPCHVHKTTLNALAPVAALSRLALKPRGATWYFDLFDQWKHYKVFLDQSEVAIPPTFCESMEKLLESSAFITMNLNYLSKLCYSWLDGTAIEQSISSFALDSNVAIFALGPPHWFLASSVFPTALVVYDWCESWHWQIRWFVTPFKTNEFISLFVYP